ncbi:Poly(A) RNA polymerase cid13 [Zalerion maritima]|uniref:polynucleotide adenylyltransferase n=1 Tax=Zalerion maritima TaxID=339359 RepID=A0AAD5WX32_9PEZI|nr:Poly(A) RNA polymerase cid13 [Zalerion maritima]
MDGRPTTAHPKHSYHSASWNRLPSATISSTSSLSTTPRQITAPALPESPSAHVAAPFDLTTFFIVPQHTSLFQAQLDQYNKLISPGRGGGGLQTAPLPPVLSAPNIQAAPRSRSSSKVLNKDRHTKTGGQNCHANKSGHNKPDKTERPVMMGKDTQNHKLAVPSKLPEMAHPLPSKPPNPSRISSGAAAGQSSSVPSTPLQHARESRDNFASNGDRFNLSSSRDHSPQNHSPRSAFSETITSQKVTGCQYESPPQGLGKRRMPYNMGNDKLPRLDLSKVKSKLAEEEEKLLTASIKSQYEKLLPTQPVEDKRRKLVQKLETLFNKQWPGHDIKVHLFGSSANLLCSDDSDVDICIETAWKDLTVCMISNLLGSKGMEKVVCIRSAKVPIVKIWDPELHLACDMNINNTLALDNTHMVKTYVEIDERVRPLIMVTKYWTKMRVINEAGIGGTFSSYTWICLIISFLQLRKPPVLPALHQRPHQRLAAKSGKPISKFADDLNQLRGFGSKNKETLGELLFGFFRFYAYEFDYDKYALSVRLGKMVTKEEKSWHVAINNRLAVEEPFNTGRNLGNTADDYSFKGVHEEIRKAFDFVAKGELGRIFDKYEFPKEEATGDRSFFQKPDKSRPILVRSASQTHGNRGRGGYRGRGNFRNNGSRRASSSVAYDNQQQPHHQQQQQQQQPQQQQKFSSHSVPINHHPLVYQNQQVQPQFYNDLINTAMAMNLRMMDYQAQAAYMNQQFQAWQQAQSQQSSQQPGTDRSRTNSFDTFDNPPLSAPIRPDLYGFPIAQLAYTSQPMQTGPSTHPSSPSATAATPAEYRRSLHRSAALAESGNPANMRSQSQPAARPHPASAQPYNAPTSQPMNQPPYFASRHGNGIPISFIPDENGELDLEGSSAVTQDGSASEDDARRYLGYQLNESTSPEKRNAPGTNGVPAFGDLAQSSQGRRRLSTDQLPQTILDRRMKRTSRSPSPLGHARAFSVGTNSAPPTSAPFPQLGNKLGIRESSPLVVNGSSVRAASSASASRLPVTTEGVVTSDAAFDNPLCISQSQSPKERSPGPVTTPPSQKADSNVPVAKRPLVVNGTTPPAAVHPHSTTPYGQQQIPMVNAFPPVHQFQMTATDFTNGSPRGQQTNRQRVMSRQQQSGMIGPLDLAVGEHGAGPNEAPQQNLSPVYETRSPPPNVYPLVKGQQSGTTGGENSKATTGKGNQRNTSDHSRRTDQGNASNQRVNGSHAKDGGYGRGPKGDGDSHGSGQWQKARRKRGGGDKNQSHTYPQSERKPPNEEDRKGG